MMSFQLSRLSDRERAFIKGLFAVVVLYTVYQFFMGTLVFTAGIFEMDFTAYYAAATAVKEGKPIYNPPPWPLLQENVLSDMPIFTGPESRSIPNYLYPPFLAYCLRPYTWLPYETAEWFWNVTLIAVYWSGIGYLINTLFHKSALNRTGCILALFLAAYWAPMFLAFRVGQITVVILFLLILHTIWALERKDIGAGICLAAAIMLKCSPLALLPFWVLQKRWKIVISSFITIILIILLTGIRSNWYFLTVIFPHMSLGEYHGINHTLIGTYYRLTLDGYEGWITSEMYNQLGNAIYVIRFLLLAGWIVVWWGTWRIQSNRSLYLNIALFTTSLNFLSPISRLHDYIYLYLPLILLVVDLKKHPSKYGWAVVGFNVAVLVMNFTPWMKHLAFDPFSKDLFYRPHLVALSLMWIYLLYRQKRLLYGNRE